jgi:UDPglucose--hexose-1-phosphate uridylyltransferase
VPEIRHNIVTRESVIIAVERARRPEEFTPIRTSPPPAPSYVATCPFCPGNEHLTPSETFRIPAQGAWQVRVVPNKFAVLDPTGVPTRRLEKIKRTIAGVGVHEVIVETPDHGKSPALLSEAEFELMLQAYHRRYSAVSSDPRVALVTVFKNQGEGAGTSLVHPHSQLVGTPIIPTQVRDRMEHALRFYDETGECLFCSVVADEMLDQVRIVGTTDDFVAFVPFAALTPFHLWIYPLRHSASFIEATDAQLADLSRLLRTVLRKVHFGLKNPDYNLSVRTPPREVRGLPYYHWYVTLVPRVTRVAGFEIGSGMFVNVSLPEESADFLRRTPSEPRGG